MLDYTVVAAKKTVDDIKRFAKIFAILTQALYIAYLVYALVIGAGFLPLNIALLAISVAYFVFYLLASGHSGKKIKGAKRSVGHTYKFIKISAASFNLAVLLYSIWAFPEEVKPISIVFATLMTVVWVLQLAIEIVSIFAERRIALFIEALKADLEIVTKPLNTAQNFVRKIRGDEPIENDVEPTRDRKMLDERVEEYRLQKREKRRGKKEKLVDYVFGKRGLKENDEENRKNDLAKK